MLVPGGNLLGHLAAPKGVHVCRFEGAWDVNADESPQQQVAPAWLAFIQSLHEVVHPATRTPGASSSRYMWQALSYPSGALLHHPRAVEGSRWLDPVQVSQC